MRVDFYQLGGVSLESVVAAIASRLLGEHQRLLVVAGDEGLLSRLDRQLWDQGEASFLPSPAAATMPASRFSCRAPMMRRTSPATSLLPMANGGNQPWASSAPFSCSTRTRSKPRGKPGSCLPAGQASSAIIGRTKPANGSKRPRLPCSSRHRILNASPQDPVVRISFVRLAGRNCDDQPQGPDCH